jgi:O-antigen/teichoic acid export membrane protein
LMNGTPRVSAPPYRRSAPSAPYPADRSRISLPGKPKRPIVPSIILAIRRIPDYRISVRNLKERAVRGAFAKLCGQAVNFALRLGFTIVLARFLDPADFGLVAMVTAVTGLYAMFASAGLSAATIQKEEITNEQISTLFWVNILLGMIFGLLSLVTAPILVWFYQEPRLFWLTVAISVGFLIGAAGIQHSALLERDLRYFAVTIIGAFSQLLGIAVGVGMAIGGFAYWALVGATTVSTAAGTACVWLTVAWIPGRPERAVGVRSLLHFGGTITLNGLIVYVAYNLEKVLLGRFWGADALGIYGRAYQLVNMPTENLNSAIGGVAFAALSRLQNEPARLKNYFLSGYSLVASMTIPLTLFGAIFAEDTILVILGPKWNAAATIFRLLTPTILIFGIINPIYWLLISIGLQVRSLKVAMVIAPLVMTAYIIGLPYGPNGVALAYSAAMTLWLIPHVVWCLHNTGVSPWDLVRAISRPLTSGILAASCVLSFEHYLDQLPSAILRLAIGGAVMFSLYLCILLFVFGQKTFYRDLLRDLLRRLPEGAEPAAGWTEGPV